MDVSTRISSIPVVFLRRGIACLDGRSFIPFLSIKGESDDSLQDWQLLVMSK